MKLLLSLVLVACAAAYIRACCTPQQWEGIQTAQAGYSAGRHFHEGIMRMRHEHEEHEEHEERMTEHKEQRPGHFREHMGMRGALQKPGFAAFRREYGASGYRGGHHMETMEQEEFARTGYDGKIEHFEEERYEEEPAREEPVERRGRRRSGIMVKFSKVSYDATNQRAAVVTKFFNNGREYNFKIITRHDAEGDAEEGTGKMYFINLKRDKCYVKNLKRGFKKLCVPGEDKKGKEFYLGLEGEGGFKCRGFGIKKLFRGGAILGHVTVNDLPGDGNRCVPVGVHLAGKMRGVGFMENIGFVNITPGIKNATVFDIPDSCAKHVDVSMMEEEVPEREHYVMAL